jgi:type II secretory pathway pseudopilin PulG
MKKSKVTLFLNKIQSLPCTGGMTFIELIVVMSLFTIFASLTLFQFSTFSGSVSIQTLSQDIALKLVQAQKSGSSGAYPNLVNPVTQAGLIPIDWTPAYGVHFDTSSGSTNHFTYFFDGVGLGLPVGTIPNGKFDDFGSTGCLGGNECLDEITINSGDHIVGLCVEVTGGNSCVVDATGLFLSSGGSTVTDLDIIFSRPNLSAKIIAYNGSGGAAILPSSIISAKISITSASGTHKKIISVYPVGQITVE